MAISFFINKVCIVTGGSSGIGRELVIQLLKLNAKVVTCSRNIERLNELKSYSTDDNLLTLLGDVSDKEQCKNIIDECIHKFKKIDIIINNAGVSMRAEFSDFDLESFEKIMHINFLGAVYISKFALPYLKESHGHLVGISSVAGFRATPGRSAYSASKFALTGFLESLRIELKKYKIKVLTIAPGFIASNIRTQALGEIEKNVAYYNNVDEKKLMSAAQCAKLILRTIVTKKQRAFFTVLGKIVVFVNKFVPSLADKLVHRFYYKNNKLVK